MPSAGLRASSPLRSTRRYEISARTASTRSCSIETTRRCRWRRGRKRSQSSSSEERCGRSGVELDARSFRGTEGAAGRIRRRSGQRLQQSLLACGDGESSVAGLAHDRRRRWGALTSSGVMVLAWASLAHGYLGTVRAPNAPRGAVGQLRQTRRAAHERASSRSSWVSRRPRSQWRTSSPMTASAPSSGRAAQVSYLERGG
jgi:hypothetical protein